MLRRGGVEGDCVGVVIDRGGGPFAGKGKLGAARKAHRRPAARRAMSTVEDFMASSFRRKVLGRAQQDIVRGQSGRPHVT